MSKIYQEDFSDEPAVAVWFDEDAGAVAAVGCAKGGRTPLSTVLK